MTSRVLTASSRRFYTGPLLCLLALMGAAAYSTGPALAAGPAAGNVPGKLIQPQSRTQLTGQALLTALQGGGYVLYFRHFHTDHTKWHEDPVKPYHTTMSVADFKGSCDRQRPLTEFGRKRARDIGTLMQKLRIPVGRVLASPYCRVIESAQLLAAREPDEIALALLHRGGDLTYEMMAKAVLPYLGAKPPVGKNTLIVAHRPQMDDIRFIEEGEAFVVQPLGDGRFNMVATIYDSDWFEAQVDVAYLGLRGTQPGGDAPPRGVTK